MRYDSFSGLPVVVVGCLQIEAGQLEGTGEPRLRPNNEKNMARLKSVHVHFFHYRFPYWIFHMWKLGWPESVWVTYGIYVLGVSITVSVWVK